ncbi:YozQ family protein [Fictibacillus enclensis]|uniref:YozQ family protein n=1 Tax=Fictibacillus enclensis TaxID=1017270 RepID=UPI0025A25463|nr:YozQ family protein [Fictibacillus enclensis]MDM5337474.1 YozQ family protein [Fictibacillus enclensis]
MEQKKNSKSKSEEVAYYEPSDYSSQSETDQGLAITHEQVSDDYMEGTIDGVMENVEGKDIPLQRKGHDIYKKK